MASTGDGSGSGSSSTNALMGVVLIRNIEVRHLVSTSLFSHANPYCSFMIGQERVKTAVHWNTAQVSWGSTTFTLLVPHELVGTEQLHVRVYDKERIRRKVLMGQVDLPLRDLLGQAQVDLWCKLEGGEPGTGGEIHLTLSYAAPSAAPL